MTKPTTIAAALTAAAAAAAPQAEAAVTDADALEGAVAREVNEARAEHGLPAYKVSYSLSRAAEAKSRSMGARGYFSHYDPGGRPFWKQVAVYYTVSGYSSWKVGQALLWTAPPLAPRTIVERWLASPTHRAVLLHPGFREVGIGAVRATHATGVYAGQNVTILTLDTGYRRR